MSSPIPPGASLRDRSVAARRITVARRLGVMAIALVLAILIWATFQMHQTAPRDTRSDSAATLSPRATRP